MTTFDHAAVIGLGLVGGSIARDLSGRGVRISAFDADATRLASALRTNVVRTALDDNLTGLRDVDVVVIATPVDAAPHILGRVARHATRARLITDVGSTKARIVETAETLGLGARFVGSHPMAGDHRSGWNASRTGLFIDAPVYLCATRDSTADALQLAHRFWLELGGKPERMTAEDHDLKLAWTSHLPHMVSVSLALALARAGVDRGYLGPGGRDVTRLAGSSPEMWTAIALENAHALESALRRTEREIATLRQAIRDANEGDLRARLAAAQSWFESPEVDLPDVGDAGDSEEPA